MDYMLLILLLQVSATASESTFACRPTVVRPGNGLPYYEVQSDRMSYNDAEAACREMEAELLTIRNNSQMITEPTRKWLSAKKRSWTHVTFDLALTFDTDLPQQLDGCTAVVLEDKKLNAKPCEEKQSAVCISQDLGYCKGSIYDYRCYFIPDAYKKSRYTFNESSVICQKESASLVAIFNQHQIKWLAQTFGGSFWTGYKYNVSSTDYFWHDGSRVINANWKMDQNMTGDCVVITESGEWEKTDCMKKEAFVCTLEVSYANIKTTCHEFEGECICFWRGDGAKTFNEAMEQCLSDGGTMLYTNTVDKSDYENFIPGMWVGISDGHTKGVFRGVDGSIFQNPGFLLPDALTGCVSNLTPIDCLSRQEFICQSRIDALLCPCKKSSGCLRVADYWDIEDPVLAYKGPTDLLIQNVENFEICWDLCVTYIGFECLVVAYDMEDKSCGLSATISQKWDTAETVLSRKRTRRVTDPGSYCMDKVADHVTKAEAEVVCTEYKSGWEIPVIRDQVMLEKLGNVTSRESKSWISGTIDLNKVFAFVTSDGEYITYSRWLEGEPRKINHPAVIVDGSNYWRTERSSSFNTVVCFLNLTAACSNVPDIENGNHVYDPTTGFVIYTCNVGYYMPTYNVTNVLITCDCNDTMDLTTVENCTAILCQEPPRVEGSKIITDYNITKLGARVRYQCNESFKLYRDGYLLNNTRIFNKTCELDSGMVSATWSGNYTCFEITCPEAVMVTNATVIKHGNKLFDNTTYICNINNRIKGSQVNTTNATCVKDDNFDGVWINVPTCEAITCPAPPAIDAAAIIVESNNTAIGAMITYKCKDGFLLQKDGFWMKDSIIFNETCHVDHQSLTGKWRENFTCVEIICPEPHDVDHATHMIHGTSLGDNVTYTCDTNYRINSTTKETNATCGYNEKFEGVWTNVPICEAISCGVPPEVKNAFMLAEVNSTNDGAIVTYQCDDGFMVQQTGPHRKYTTIFNIICEVDYSKLTGKWKGHYICVLSPTCAEPPEVLYSKVVITGFYPGGISFFTCDPGYVIVYDADSNELTNKGQSTCMLDPKNGTLAIWDKIPQCEIIHYDKRARQCPPPDDVDGGKVEYKDQFFESYATYTTYTVYTFENCGTSRTSICQLRGRWSVTSPKLQRKTCTKLHVSGSTLSTEINDVGTKVEIRCIDPMAKMENGLARMSVRCEESQRWSYLPRSCKVNRCGPFEHVKHGSLTAYNNSVGGYAVISCHLSYRFSDGTKTKKSQCLQTFRWQSVGRCLFNTCLKLREPRFGKISTNLALENTVVDIKCLPGYMFPDGNITKQTTCDSSFKWSSEIEDCQVINCPEPREIANAKITARNTLYNSTINYRCDGIYRLENGYRELTIRCGENGKWNQTSFSCELGCCPPLPEVKNAKPDTSLAVNGTIATYTCHEGHVFSTNSSIMTLSCNGVEWNITETICSAVRCPILNLTHAHWSDNGNNFGDSVSFTCEEGFQYNNSNTGVLKCQANAEWTGDPKGCRPISCGPPPDVLHAIQKAPKNNFLGAFVTYKCRDKYWFRRGVIQTSIWCDKTGLWSYVPSKCTPITCPVIPTWHDKKANSTQRHIGAVVNVTSTKHRDEGTTLLIARCTHHGEWEPSLDENLTSFIPEAVEAEYSRGIGVIVTSVMLSFVVGIILNDLRQITNDVKSIKCKRRQLLKTKNVKSTK